MNRALPRDSGAAPATVSSELLPTFTSLMRPRIGKTRERRRPASQETCRDTEKNVHGRGVPAVACRSMPALAAAHSMQRPLRHPASTTPRGLPMSNLLNLISLEAKAAPLSPVASRIVAAPEGALPMQVIRRNGTVSKFDASKISVAMTKAFLAVEGHTAAASRRVHEIVEQLTAEVVGALSRRISEGRTFHIEDVQDQVELALMRSEHHKVARAYVLYRDERTRQRAEQEAAKSAKPSAGPSLHVTLANGAKVPLDTARLALDRRARPAPASTASTPRRCSPKPSAISMTASAEDELALAVGDGGAHAGGAGAQLRLCQRAAAARQAAHRGAVVSCMARRPAPRRPIWPARYGEYFPAYIKTGIRAELLDPDLARFDLKKLAAALKPERDLAFQFLGLQTLYDRYFLHEGGNRIELPQAFFMRVAMGLAVREIDREARAIEFYDLLSSFDFMASTPTLFNSGTLRPQLSSCFLTTVADDLDGIFKSVKDNALLAKYSGGLGNDWTPRARARRPHQGHQRRKPGRGAVPESRQRHRDRRQPGRQAQGRGLRLSRDLAHRHRGIPRSAQEHRRRPPPHPRHEHRELGARPVHAARRGRRRMDAVLAGRDARSARPLRPAVRRALRGL